jgi:hypothetical protein
LDSSGQRAILKDTKRKDFIHKQHKESITEKCGIMFDNKAGDSNQKVETEFFIPSCK